MNKNNILSNLHEVYAEVFGDNYNLEPDVYADYDKCIEISKKLKDVILFLEQERSINSDVQYEIGDPVQKFTGDYKAFGEIRGHFRLEDGGPLRYIVRHEASGGGYFCHIYGPNNIKPVERILE